MAAPLSQEINTLIQQLNHGQFETVIQRARPLAAQYPREFILHHLLALALDQTQQYVLAAQAYEKALQLNPKAAELWFNYATDPADFMNMRIQVPPFLHFYIP